MPIELNNIPSDITLPGTYAEFDSTNARSVASGRNYRGVIYGQKLAAGSAAADVAIQIQSKSAAVAAFGAGSILARMVAAFIKQNPNSTLYCIPQADDAAGVARVVEVDYTAAYATAPTGVGVEQLYIGPDAAYKLAITSASTATTVAAAMAALVEANDDCPFSATAAAGKLTLTAKNKGIVPNDIQVAYRYYDTDSAATGTYPTITQKTAGATNPSVAAGIASASNMDMTHVVMPYKDATNYALMLAEAQDRWGPMPSETSLGNGQEDFMVFGAFRGSEAQCTSFKSGRNSEYFVTLALEPGQTIDGVAYPGTITSDFEAAAIYAAKSIALCKVVANKPHQNTILVGLRGAPKVCQFAWPVRNRLAKLGLSTAKYNASGQVLLETGITERTLTDDGMATDAERRIETQFAKSHIRYTTRSTLDSEYPNFRLADDGTAGLPQSVATPKMIKGTIIALAVNSWVPQGIIENLSNFISTLVVERSTDNCDTIKFQMFPDLVNVLVVKAGSINYIVC